MKNVVVGINYDPEMALLHKSAGRLIFPFHRQTYPAVCATGMPSAVKPFTMAIWTWNWPAYNRAPN